MIRSLWVWLIGRGMNSVMDGDLMIDRGGVGYYGGSIAGNFGCVDWGGVVHRLNWAVGRGGGGVAIHSSVVDRGGVVDGVVDWAGSISVSFCMD